MRRILFLAVLACCSIASAQVAIEVPDKPIEIGRTYLLPVTGLDANNLPRTALKVSPGDSARAVGVTGWAGEQYIWFEASAAGRYTIVVAVNGEIKPDLTLASLDVGGESPNPPPPPPPEEEVWGVILIEESEERTHALAKILVGTEVSEFLESKDLIWKPADQHVIDVGGETPQDLVPYIAEAKERGLPRLYIMGVNGHEFYAGEVPKDSAAVIKLVKQYLKED